MITRRFLAGCALCAAGLTAAAAAKAQPAREPLMRTELRRLDHSANLVVVQMMVDIVANAPVARHTHPGMESSLVLEGELMLGIEGQGERQLKRGDGFQVPTGVVHWGRAGASDCKLFAHFVVEKDKPLASPA
jgi:quercetin dioxygenase-like cupin family protein